MLEITYAQSYLLIGISMALAIVSLVFHLKYLTKLTLGPFTMFFLVLIITFLWPIILPFLAISRPIRSKRV